MHKLHEENLHYVSCSRKSILKFCFTKLKRRVKIKQRKRTYVSCGKSCFKMIYTDMCEYEKTGVDEYDRIATGD